MKDIRINEATFPLANGGVGKIAVFIYGGTGDPRAHLYCALQEYVGDSKVPYKTFIDAQLNCPWVLTLISNIDDMRQSDYNGETLTQLSRNDALDDLFKFSDELPNWYCPHCNQTNRVGWDYCIDCNTAKP